MVMPAEQPTIAINGTPNLAREYESFMQGIELFNSISIFVNQENDGDGEAETGDNEIDEAAGADDGEDANGDSVPAGMSKLMGEHKLDSCNIQVYPPLNPDHEYFRVPTNMMEHLEIRHKETKDGIVIYGKITGPHYHSRHPTHTNTFPYLFLQTKGADSVHNYQQILRQLIYFNRKPAYYLNRAFKLSCSELNGRFSSNDYIQTLTVIHPKVEPTDVPQTQQQTNVVEVQPVPPAHAMVHDHKVDLKDARIKQVSGFFDSSIVDASDNFARATPSEFFLPHFP